MAKPFTLSLLSSLVLSPTSAAGTGTGSGSGSGTSNFNLLKHISTSEHVHAPSELLPKGWTSLKRSGSKLSSSLTKKDSSDPTGYFIANGYDNGSCGGEKSFAYATGTGVCFVGMSNNTAVGSVFYDFGGVAGSNFFINQGIWESLDCSGTPVVNTFPIPTTCLTDDEDPNSSYVYTYTTSSSPWDSYNPGFIFEFYDTEDRCTASDEAGSFVYYPLNKCILSDDGHGFMFSACDSTNGVYTVVNFEDSECKAFDSAFTTKLESCSYQDSDSDDDMDVSTYATFACN